MRIDYKADLDPEQYEAVSAIDGAMLIIAGAGSGKTRVITYRMAYMLDKGVAQSAILALTFTNKAAREMSGRVRNLVGKKLPNLTVSTFHSFGVKILRKEISRLGYRENFSIYDESDRTQLVKDCAREKGFRMEGFDAYKVGALFSRIRSGQQTWSKADDAYKDLYDEYRRSLKIFNALDFDDLIALPLELFTQEPELCASWRDRYRYLMIDEFQDTSTQQYELMRRISGDNVCVVGDDDQSIYSWRGANYENLVRFERDFPALKEVKLERNYRSTSTILDAANALISHNENRKEKALWSPGGLSGKPIELYTPEDEGAEADFIARSIKEQRREAGISWGGFGILMRTNNLARRIEEALLAEQVPYKLSGGTSFYSRKEVKDLISYLRVIANPDDDVNLLRVVNTPRRGIGKTSLERLSAMARPRSSSIRSAMELVRAAAAKGEDLGFTDRAAADISAFLDLVDEYREALLGKKRIAAKVRELVDRVDYWAYLVEENRQNDKAAKWKFHNVELLIKSIEDWEKDPDNLSPGLYEWLNRVALVTREDSEEEDQGRVNLMTIHAAKGLEFDVVFIAGCEDGIIPHARAIEEGEANREEERRLFYVAVTRARRRLIISSCLRRRKQNQTVDCLPSPFLQEIPQELMQVRVEESALGESEGEERFASLLSMFGSDNDVD